MLNIFRKPVEELSSTESVVVYSATGYGRGTIFLSPGVDHHEVEGWTKGPNREPAPITVRFHNGAAEVPANLAEYMVRHGYAHRKPQPIPVPIVEQALAAAGASIKYQTPIAVGRPLQQFQEVVQRDLASHYSGVPDEP